MSDATFWLAMAALGSLMGIAGSIAVLARRNYVVQYENKEI